jgi:hypothetical protein
MTNNAPKLFRHFEEVMSSKSAIMGLSTSLLCCWRVRKQAGIVVDGRAILCRAFGWPCQFGVLLPLALVGCFVAC